jgi:y4mF family transcriptional regulator
LILRRDGDNITDREKMKIRTTAQLGTAIRARRKQLHITQRELAMTCGTGLRFIVDLEKGKPTCHIGKALDVLRSLGLAIEIGPAGSEAVRGNKT